MRTSCLALVLLQFSIIIDQINATTVTPTTAIPTTSTVQTPDPSIIWKLTCDTPILFEASFSALAYPQIQALSNKEIVVAWSQINEGIFSTFTDFAHLTDPTTSVITISNQSDTLIKLLKTDIDENLVYIHGDFQEKIYYAIYSNNGAEILPNTELTSSSVVLPRYQAKVSLLSDDKFVIVWKPSMINVYNTRWQYKIIDIKNGMNSLGPFDLAKTNVFNDYIYDNAAICNDQSVGDTEIFTVIWRENQNIYVSVIDTYTGNSIVDNYKLDVNVANLRGYFVCVRSNALYQYDLLVYKYVVCMNAMDYVSSFSDYDILCMSIIYDHYDNSIEITQVPVLINTIDSTYKYVGNQLTEMEMNMLYHTKYVLICFTTELNGRSLRSSEDSIVCSIINSLDLYDISVENYYVAVGDTTFGYDAPSVRFYNETHFIITYYWFNDWARKIYINWCEVNY